MQGGADVYDRRDREDYETNELEASTMAFSL
jgi:hypothetical protein